MRGRLVSARRTLVDGVPAYYVEGDVPFFATLAFRVGRADEQLAWSGLTHLVEHLAMPIADVHGLEENATVQPSSTLFYALGPVDTVHEFLEDVAAGLASLPLERLETERRILETEAAGGGPGPIGTALSLRFGARGYGLSGYAEYGLHRAGPEDVVSWASEWFTRENAVLWMTRKPPRGLRLPLPSGRRVPAPEPQPIEYLRFPCLYDRGSDTVTLTAMAPRSTALVVACAIAQRRLRRRLRYEGGLSYIVDSSYEPFTATHAHVAFVADLLEANAEAVRDIVVETLRGLATDGPTTDELERELEQTRREMADPYGAATIAGFDALNELFGARSIDSAALLREHEAITPATAAQALSGALETAMLVVPFDVGATVEGFDSYILRSPSRIEGRRYRPGRIRRKADPVLVAGPDGVAVESEDARPAVRFDECVAALRWADGSRGLYSTDGFFVEVDPSEWRHGEEIVRLVDEHVPPELWVSMEAEREERVTSVERASSEGGIKRSWTSSSELDALPDLLRPGEEVVLATGAMRGWKWGVLAVTTQRLLFLYFEDLVVEVRREDIGRVETKDAGLIMDTQLIVEAEGDEILFTGLGKDVLPRTAELLRAS